MASAMHGIDRMWNWALCLTLGFTGSATAQEESPKAQPPGLEQLRLLGEIELSASPGAHPAIRDVETFAVDSSGRFVLLRPIRPPTLVVLDGDSGQVVSEIVVPIAGMGSRLFLQDAEHVLVSRGNWIQDPILFSSVNLITKEVRDVRTIALRADDETWRGATWLGPDRLVSWAPRLIGCWTDDGRLAWSLKQSDRLANVDAICTTSNGRLAILDRNGEVGVQFIYPEGRIGPYIHLKEAWGREGIVALDILPATDGGLWIVHWADDGSRLARTDANCRLLQEWTPRYPNGARVQGSPAVSPRGEVWIVDSAAFVRLDRDGVVDRVVGETRENAPLREASMVRVGPDGRIYAADERDHAVHVFDDEGRELRVVRPTTYAEDGRTPRTLGEVEWVEKRWYPVGTTGKRWEVEDHIVRLVDPSVGELRAYRDVEWPESEVRFEAETVAPSGALAVALFRGTEVDRYLLHVALLDPDKEEVGKIQLPGKIRWLSSMAFDGKRIAIANSEMLELFDESLNSILRLNFPRSSGAGVCGNAPDTSARVDFARGSSELWLRNGDFGTTIKRYALP
jgi:hypothetical protein